MTDIDKTELYAALMEVQKEIENPPNTAKNPFFKSKYAPLPDILNYIRPLLNKNGLLLIQDVGSCEGNTPFVQTTLVHIETKAKITTAKLGSPLKKKEAQGVGAAITYLRRFQLVTILAISGEDDTDGEIGDKNNKAAETSGTTTPNKPKPTSSKPTQSPSKPSQAPSKPEPSRATDEEAAQEVVGDFQANTKSKPKKPTPANAKTSTPSQANEGKREEKVGEAPVSSVVEGETRKWQEKATHYPELGIVLDHLNNSGLELCEVNIYAEAEELNRKKQLNDAQYNKVMVALGKAPA